jgi:transcriptional regulator with XRE-family HTH domain
MRRRAKLSQMDMVRRYGWELSQYQRIERGVSDVKLSTMGRLARCYGVKLETLVRGL